MCDHVHIDHACSTRQALDRCVPGDGHWSPKAGLCRAESIWSQTKSNPSPMLSCLPLSRGWASSSVTLAEGYPTSSGCSAPSVAHLCSERDVRLIILCCWSFSQEEMLKFLSLSTMIMSHSPAKPGLGVWDFLELGGPQEWAGHPILTTKSFPWKGI